MDIDSRTVRVALARTFLLAFVLLAGATMSLRAQAVGTIHGQVVTVSGAALSGAYVRIASLSRTAVSGSRGNFSLERVPVGRHTLDVAMAGHVPRRIPVEVKDDGTSRVVVELTVSVATLAPAVATARATPGSVAPAPDVVGQLVLAGAKSEVLQVSGMDANLSEKTGRQVFARVPGVFVYDMDGSGNQVNISTRGLDPHRSWEMNVRQDGVLVNSDMYGYPASHYSPPLEAMQRIELVRGTAALQYGSQFGGLINYVTRTPDTTRAVAFSSINSAGSFGLLSTFDAVGGKVGRVTYYGYLSGRRSNGYRANAESRYSAQYLRGSIALAPNALLRMSVARSAYRYRIPGPLTDSMFAADPRNSTRARNWYSPDITVPSATLEWQTSATTRVTAQVAAVTGDRSSVQFIGFANVVDRTDPVSGTQAPRQVDIDDFLSRSAGVQLTHDYNVGPARATLATGITVANNNMRRRQQGRGTTGDAYDLTLSSGDFGRDIRFRTKAGAVYGENLMRIGRLAVVPGFRAEFGKTNMSGRLSYYDPADIPKTVDHRFPLFGIRGEFRVDAVTGMYGGWSQGYRPMILKDLLPESAIERTDPAIKDARGWTFESGVRGSRGGMTYDASVFALRYDDRFGVVVGNDPNGSSFLFKTNVGSTLTKGVELHVDVPLLYTDKVGVRAFTAASYFDARYRHGTIVSGGVNQALGGYRVEGVPEWIARSGLTMTGRGYSATFLVSHVGASYADPLNTVAATPNGARGRVPSYTVVDINTNLELSSRVRVGGGVGNLLDRQYFTKRPTFYPGPGIWPSDGRSVRASLELDW